MVSRLQISNFLRERWQFFVLPSFAAFLPWALCYRLFHSITWRHSCGIQTEFALQSAIENGFVPDHQQWIANYRLTQLIDRADAFLSRFRSDRWLQKHVTVEGDEWPTGPCIGITFHFGAGLWALRHLCNSRTKVAVLLARPDPSQQATALAYARFRAQEVERIACTPVIYTGGAKKIIRACLAAGDCVVGLIDVPPGFTQGEFCICNFLGRTCLFPLGLLRLADEAKVPVVLYVSTIRNNGDRLLRVTHIHGDAIRRMNQIVSLLEAHVRAEPTAWHMWATLKNFFVDIRHAEQTCADNEVSQPLR